MTANDRFRAGFITRSPQECWPWKAAIKGGRYGQFWIGKVRKPTHRYAWEIMRGPIPKGLLVLHKCDNPPCVNPNHLFLGTTSDNAKDAAWANEKYGPREFIRNRMGDYVEREVNERFPIPTRKREGGKR